MSCTQLNEHQIDRERIDIAAKMLRGEDTDLDRRRLQYLSYERSRMMTRLPLTRKIKGRI